MRKVWSLQGDRDGDLFVPKAELLQLPLSWRGSSDANMAQQIAFSSGVGGVGG